MTYEDIYSSFYLKIDDPTFFNYSKEDAYGMMRIWLHDCISIPYIRKVFSSIKLNDETQNIRFVLNDSVDEDSDNYFVINLLSSAMVVAWLKPKVESITNIAMVIGGKDEKRLQSNYKITIDRLDSLETKIRKMISDYGYQHNDYLLGN